MLRLNVVKSENAEPICEKCGGVLREERSHYRCETCGIVEACCEGQKDIPVTTPPLKPAVE